MRTQTRGVECAGIYPREEAGTRSLWLGLSLAHLSLCLGYSYADSLIRDSRSLGTLTHLLLTLSEAASTSLTARKSIAAITIQLTSVSERTFGQVMELICQIHD